MNALQSFIRLVLTLFVFTACVFSQKSYAQYTETFETATAGTSSFVNNGKKFVNNGKTFNLTSSYVGFNVINSNGLGYGPSNKFIPIEDDALGAPIGVLLSTSPILTFTDATGLSSMATDGTGGSTEISDLDLQIFSGSKTTGVITPTHNMEWNNSAWFAVKDGFTFTGITVGPNEITNSNGFPALILKSSSQAANFSLKSIRLLDWGGASPVQIAGYNNGTLVNSVSVVLPGDGEPVTKSQSDELTPAYFNDIDEVRIYSNTGNIWVGVNNIQIGSPVASAVPTISSATYDASTGILTVNATNIVGGDTIDGSKLSITGQGGSYTLTSANVTASSSTAFSITLNSADKLYVNGILNKNGTVAVDATTFNLAAAANWDVTTSSTADLTGNGITVSNVTAPTITSATYNGSTGVLAITGTGFVKAIGATNDVTVSKFTITGETGATRTISTTGNVEIINATSISLTLSGADIAAVNSLLNKNGTSSVTGTTYNLAAADDWNTVITGGNIADLTGNGITVSNAKPTIESATYNASTGVLAVTAANMVAGDTMDASKLSITGQGGSYTLTSANVTASSSTAFSITLNAADKLNINGILNKNGTVAVDVTTFNLAAAANWDATTTSTADLNNIITAYNVIAPTITSATYDGNTHVFTITGTGLVKAIGVTNDITVNKFTLKGANGATHTLSTTGSVEITSATSATFTLAGTDIVAVNNLLNKNGTSSITGTTYNLAAADDWNTVITDGDISDLTSNGITVSNAKPTIQSATYNASTGVLAVTAANIVGGDDIVSSKLSITGQGGSYTLTSANVTASSSTAFSITLNAADKINVNGILNKNGTTAVDATTFNIAAAADWNIITASTADLTSNAITVSNVTPPTITSATYDGATGIFTITGTGFVKAIGATNDISVSKFTITGGAGTTHALNTTGNVEVISATSASITLTGADIAAVNNLLNKNGTSSITGTNYNLAVADDWNTVITDGDISDLTSNGITVSNFVPVPTILNISYLPQIGLLGINATNTFIGDVIDVSKFSITGQNGASYTLTSANFTSTNANRFDITLNDVDKIHINGILNRDGMTAVDLTPYNLSAATNWNITRPSAADLTGNFITVMFGVVPTITSATYDGSTSVLTITGADFVKAPGATNDITVSKFTITGANGATHTLSTTGNVEITNATTVSLTLAGADIAAVNTLLNKNGTSSITGTTYNLAAADDWNTVITGGDISDLTSNGITVSNAKPTIESATYNASTGVLAVTAANMVAGDTIDPSKLSITGQGGSYTLTSANVTASSSTAFSITLNSADKLNVNGILNKNGVSAVDATVFNLAAAANWDVTTSSTADLTGNGITVSNVIAPTITSVNYDTKFSTLTITGSNLVKAIGATNDITVNKFTITGDNQTTYTFSTTGNVEVVSGSLISITLTGTDIAAVNALLNKDGTSSITGTIYNFAAADDWNTVVTGGNIADLTGNGITVSNAKPAIESATYNASTGVLAITAANMVAGDTMDASKLSITGQGGSYTLTSANVTASSSTAFSITLNVADKLNINGILNKNGTVAVDVTTFNLAAAANWNATTASTADLTSNAITVSNVTAPTITSATYNGSTGVLVITGTGLVKAIGATNDVTVSKFTITGETGATRTISTTGNVEIINATSISLTLSGADIAAVNSLLNKNGTSSVTGTNYNLAAADDWNTVITDTDIADLTNGITVSNAVNNAPTANADTYTVTRGGTLTTTLLNGLLLNDTDPEGSSLTASLITFPDNFSSFTFNQNGTFTYVHDGSATSSDSFTYRVSDGSLNSNTATVTINITTPVFVDFITRTSAAFSNATSKQYIVEFSESVTGVDASDFTLTTTGGVNATIGTPTGSGADWTVPVTSITGNGTLRLDFTNKTGVTPNVNANYTSGQIYTFDQTSPTVSSINLAGTSPTNATSVAYTVTFSEAVTGVDINDFTLTKSGNAIGNIVSVSGSGNTYTVTVNTVSGNGTLRLDLNASGTGINDAVSNILIGGYTSGNLYTIENPNINSVTGTLSALSTIYGTASSAGSFSFAAVNLTTGVTLTAPSGFELSTNLSSGYANPLTVGTAGNLAATTIYVRLKADAKAVSSPYSGNITMSTAGATDVTIATASSTVAVKSLTLALNATPLVTKTYDALTIATLVSANYSLTGIEGSDAVTVTGTANYDTKTIGTAKTITANAFVLAGADKDNYSLTTTSATTTGNITSKSLTLALNATPLVTKTYDALTSATLVSANYSLTGIQGSDAVTVTGTANYDNKDFGTSKTITANAFVLGGIDAGNYTLSNTSATTTGNITQTDINVIAIANHKTYGSADPLLSYSFSPELIAGDKFSGSLTRVAGEDVGDYAISIGTLAVNANYNIIFTTANLSITKSIVMVRADFKSKIYGDADPTLTYTVTGVSGTGNVFTGALARTAGENVNSYRITQGTLALNGNYQMSFEGSEFSIAPRSLVIKADDQSKYVGVANPMLTFTFSGFKTGETSSVLTKQPQISTTATTASVAGNYDISVSGAAASNYAISYQKGILTINDINSVPTLDAIANQSICATVGERQIALNGISAGKEVGQTVTLSVSSSNAALFSSLSVNKGTGNSGTLSYRPATGAIGTATITVTLKDDGGTQAGGVDTYSRSFTITINAIPVVTITSDKGLSVAKGETLVLTATGGTSYVWNNASGIVSGQSTAVLNIRPTVTTTYSVTATSATGCTSTQSITIQVTEEAVAAKPTNIMSPNGDGINDKWVIENIDLYPNNVVIVVDRSGRTIYSKKGYDNSWDATLRGLPLAEGTYYYIINYGDGKTPAKKGFITILNKK